MKIVFSDLDGTLLDYETYAFEPAVPALQELGRRGFPLVLTTSKTRAEVEVWRKRLRNDHPFIVENGGAVLIPAGYFPFAVPNTVQRDGYDVIELGAPYASLTEALRIASAESETSTVGFSEMTVAQVAAETGLTMEEAALAKVREYDEPFLIPENVDALQLLRRIEGLGKRWTKGGRFYHITGENDKAQAMRRLAALYRRLHPDAVLVALGDGLNDVELLRAADVAIVIRSSSWRRLKEAVPEARVTSQPGPAGWAEAILEVIPE